MKKGYFYILDAFLALSMITLGLIFIFSFHSQKPYVLPSLFLSGDILDYLADTSVEDIDNDYALDLINQSYINNTKNSLLEQTAIFYLMGESDVAEKFLHNVTHGVIPEHYGGELLVYNKTTIFNVTIQSGRRPMNQSRRILVAKNMILGLKGETSTWSPMMGEVRIWD